MSDYKYQYLLRLLCHVGHRAARAVFNSFDSTLAPQLTVVFIPLDESLPMRYCSSDPALPVESIFIVWDPDRVAGYQGEGRAAWKFDPFAWSRSRQEFPGIVPSDTFITLSSSVHSVQDTAVIFLLHLNRRAYSAYRTLPRGTVREYAGERLNFVARVADHLLSELLHGADSVVETRFVYPVKIDVDRMLRRAAEDMVGVVDAFYNDDEDIPTLYEDLNAIASLRCELHPTPGSLLLIPDGADCADSSITFMEPVSLSDHRSVHRIIEMAGNKESLLCSGGCVVGLGALKRSEQEYNNVYKIVFARHLQWEFWNAGAALMIVTQGHPLPSQLPFEKAALECALRHEFSGYNRLDISGLWKMVQEAIGQSSSITLVISDAAEQEADRLKGESLRIRPQMISSRILQLAASTDGAMLLTPDGLCHAIGVGLDGIATELGEGARSARVHAAMRYQQSARRYLGHRSVVVVISDEGLIDVISSLQSPVARHAVEENFNRLTELLESRHDGNALEIHELLVWFDEHRSGLTERECRLLNRAMYWLPADLHGYIYMPYYRTWKPMAEPDAGS